MAATSISYSLVESTIPGSPTQYSVVVNPGLVANVNIDKYVFIYRYSDQVFDHVATLLDVLTYPTVTPNPAFPYYRMDNVTKLTTNVSEALDFVSTVQSRLTSLAKEYDLNSAAFVPGTYPVTVP